MDDEQRNAEMGHLVADVYELAGVLRRDGEQIARLAGQTQARWQLMSVAAGGRLSVAMIARRLGLTRQSVQRVADEIVAEKLASYQPNPDHQRSPLLILNDDGHNVLDTINHTSRERHLQLATALGDDAIAELRQLLGRYRDAVTQGRGRNRPPGAGV
jgi:DNA-binding MarR family transcriptional regulator